jgi:predicted phosphodiesterase
MYLIFIGDTHLGEKGFTMNSRIALKEIVDFAKINNTIIILIGDLVNCATASSLASFLSQNMNLDEQIDLVDSFLYPIRKKIIGSIIGNHEANGYKMTGSYPTKQICKDLSVPFWGFRTIQRIKVGKIDYWVSVHHGHGGGRALGSKINNLDKRRGYNYADIYAMGHTHMLGIIPVARFVPDEKTGREKLVYEYEVHTGSFLDSGATEYSSKTDYPPLPIGTPVLYLDPKVKRVGGWISSNLDQPFNEIEDFKKKIFLSSK